MLAAMKAAIESGVKGMAGSTPGTHYILFAQSPTTGAKLLVRPLLAGVFGGVMAVLRLHLHPTGESEVVNTFENTSKTVFYPDHAHWKDTYPGLPFPRSDHKRCAGELALGIPSGSPKEQWAAVEHFVVKGGARRLWNALVGQVPKPHLKVTQEQFTTFINAAMREMSKASFPAPDVPTKESIAIENERLAGKIAALNVQIGEYQGKIATNLTLLEKGLPTLADMLPALPAELTVVKPDNEVEKDLVTFAKANNVKSEDDDNKLDHGDDANDGDED